jgi:hypothetical protein
VRNRKKFISISCTNKLSRWRRFYTDEENANFFAELEEREEMLAKNKIVLQWESITTKNYRTTNRTGSGASQHRNDGDVEAWTEPEEEATKDVVEGNTYSKNHEMK